MESLDRRNWWLELWV